MKVVTGVKMGAMSLVTTILTPLSFMQYIMEREHRVISVNQMSSTESPTTRWILCIDGFVSF